MATIISASTRLEFSDKSASMRTKRFLVAVLSHLQYTTSLFTSKEEEEEEVDPYQHADDVAETYERLTTDLGWFSAALHAWAFGGEE